MNNLLYEDYMRSVLGYSPIEYQDTYDTNYNTYNSMYNRTNFEIQELENCYPDIYVLVYPMVQKICMNNTRPITKELVDEMTKEIYFSIEDNEIGETRGKEENTNVNSKDNIENRTIQIKNRTLNDLIRILILRELLGRPGNIPGRLPRPRPPQPQTPRPPMRPPMPRTDIRGYNIGQYDIFENDYNLF